MGEVVGPVEKVRLRCHEVGLPIGKVANDAASLPATYDEIGDPSGGR